MLVLFVKVCDKAYKMFTFPLTYFKPFLEARLMRFIIITISISRDSNYLVILNYNTLVYCYTLPMWLTLFNAGVL